jgi:hypothetical protein
MRSFEYRRAADRTEALSFAEAERARYLGGGTNLVDLMRQNIEARLLRWWTFLVCQAPSRIRQMVAY